MLIDLQEMASEDRKQADQALKEMNFHKSLGAGEPEAETSAFQCMRCKQASLLFALSAFV